MIHKIRVWGCVGCLLCHTRAYDPANTFDPVFIMFVRLESSMRYPVVGRWTLRLSGAEDQLCPECFHFMSLASTAAMLFGMDEGIT